MANCNCIYEEFCSMLNGEDITLPTPCEYRKDRSRFVELPCKIGQIVYEVVYFRNGTVSHISPLKVVGIHIGNFPDLRGHRRKNYLVVVYPTSEILGRISLDKFGKTLFPAKEEAEAALARTKG